MIDIFYFFYFKIYSLINKTQIYYFNRINEDLFIKINLKLNSINYSLNKYFYRIANNFVNIEYEQFEERIKGITNIKRNQKIIVSLTSIPSRINTLWICIESLLRQTVKPDEIILWLADSQFNGLSSLPNSLIELQRRGLTIRFCDDLKAHKKYYYSFKEYPDDIVITVDDDAVYSSNTIKELLAIHNKFPNCICCNFAFLITFNDKGLINSTSKWPGIFTNIINKPTDLLLPVGVSGVLYPPKSINNEVFNKEVFKEICFYNDDLWLKVMSILNNTKVIQTACFPGHFFGIKGTQEEALLNYNIAQNGNDIQFNALIKKYKLKPRKKINYA
jgi:hypothetical protein